MLYTRTSTYRNEVKFFASTLQNQKSPSEKCANAYTYGFNGKEKVDEISGSGNNYDFGARIYNPGLGRFLSVDPLANVLPGWSPYAFVRDNPILRIDPDGRWDIEVHVYKSREKYGYGIAIVKDRNGKEIYRFNVRVEGTGGRNRTVKNSDTPLGTYDIPDNNMWKAGGSRKSYGPNYRLVLNPESGEIKDSKRDEIRIHGGRQETYNSKTGEWEAVENPALKKTHGCIRCYDGDIETLKSKTDAVQANDPFEIGGKLKVIDDLVEDKNGNFVLPQESSTNSKKSSWKGLDFYLKRTNESIKKSEKVMKE